MVLFSIFMGISLFKREIQMGSISMLLSKPISRTSFLIGKYLGQILVQLGVLLSMTTVILISCLRFDGVNFIAVSEALLLIYFETCIIAAITYFFAVNAGSITAAIASFVFFAIGHYSDEPVRKTVTSPSILKQLIKAIFPNLEVFNLKTFASYGVTLLSSELGLSCAYAILCSLMFLILACLTFERKDILT
jgi:Cu-processing system permease protein